MNYGNLKLDARKTGVIFADQYSEYTGLTMIAGIAKC